MRADPQIEDELTYRDVIDILELVRQSEYFAFVDFTVDPTRISVERWSENSPLPAALHPQRSSPSGAADANVAAIAAPVLGRFLRQQDGKPPAAEVGSLVSNGDALGYIDTMGQLTPVLSSTHGEVAEILVEHGAFVEYAQPLMRIRER